MEIALDRVDVLNHCVAVLVGALVADGPRLRQANLSECISLCIKLYALMSSICTTHPGTLWSYTLLEINMKMYVGIGFASAESRTLLPNTGCQLLTVFLQVVVT